MYQDFPVHEKYSISGNVYEHFDFPTVVQNMCRSRVYVKQPLTLKEIFHEVQHEATLIGLNSNKDKTKYMQIKRTGTKDTTHLKIDNSVFENVENFNYLGTILNADNKMNIQIAERIVKGNKANCVNAKLIKSKFLKRSTKMKIYIIIIIMFMKD
jgi:hypothetical protein